VDIYENLPSVDKSINFEDGQTRSVPENMPNTDPDLVSDFFNNIPATRVERFCCGVNLKVVAENHRKRPLLKVAISDERSLMGGKTTWKRKGNAVTAYGLYEELRHSV
jgi:hypothetical protein